MRQEKFDFFSLFFLSNRLNDFNDRCEKPECSLNNFVLLITMKRLVCTSIMLSLSKPTARCLKYIKWKRHRYDLFYNLYKITLKLIAGYHHASLLDITDFDLLPDDTDNLIWRNSQKVLRTFTLACVQDDDLSFKLTPNYEHICNS